MHERKYEPYARLTVGRLLIAVLLAAMLTGCGDAAVSSRQLVSAPATIAPTPAAPVAVATTAPTTPPTGPQKGLSAPIFALSNLLGGPKIDLAKLRGHPVWLNFWATWCEFCQGEMPAMQKAYEQYKSTPLVMLGLDMNEDPMTVRRFVDENELGWTFAIDRGKRISRLYAVPATPTHVFIRADGVINAVYVGELDLGQIKEYVGAIMN